tara:strand:- start:1250 stop:1735 length:486 start_codon:yes stop_codon:yes gene_type:complete
VNADTNAIIPTMHGHTSGSVINIDYEPYIGTTEIEIIVNDFGVGELSDTVSFYLTIEENLANDIDIYPRIFELKNAYPNPFNPTVTIEFEIEKKRKVSAYIYNINGEKVKTLFKNQNFNVGHHSMKWHSKNELGYKVSNGIYFIQIISENTSLKRKIIFVK